MKSIIVGLVLATSMAFAADHQTLNFDNLKAACKDPKRFQNQLKPTSIKIDCADKVVRWIPAGMSQTKMPSKRIVMAGVSSDKYTVPRDSNDVEHTPYTGECPVLKQIEETVAISQEITCEQIENYTGSATALCARFLDGLKNDNPSAIQTKETGKVATFCKPDSSKVEQPAPPKGKLK